jgi:hypothetical protein
VDLDEDNESEGEATSGRRVKRRRVSSGTEDTEESSGGDTGGSEVDN